MLSGVVVYEREIEMEGRGERSMGIGSWRDQKEMGQLYLLFCQFPAFRHAAVVLKPVLHFNKENEVKCKNPYSVT